MDRENVALDVWLKWPNDDPPGGYDLDDAAEYEANTFRTGDGYTVEWYHTAVGQVSSRYFDTYREATAWLESEGFQDFSS